MSKLTKKELEERVRILEDALRPFARYALARMKMPIKGLGDSVHTIHGGTEHEGTITFTDCREALVALRYVPEVTL